MGSRGALLTLTLIAAALATAVTLDRTAPRTTGPRTTRIVPGLAVSEVVGLRWRRAGVPAVAVRRVDGGFMLEPGGRADERVVADVLAALPMLAYRRRLPDRAPRTVAWELEVERAAAAPLTLRVGPAAPGLGQTWVGVRGAGDDAAGYLVNDSALGELDRRADELRARELFPVAADAVSAIELTGEGGTLVLSGRPLSVHLVAGGRARVEPERARAALAAVTEARLVELSDAEPPTDVLRVRVVGGVEPYEVAIGGPCRAEAGRWVVAAAGTGCAPVEALVELARAEPEALVDRRLWPLDADEVAAIERGDERLEARSGVWPGDQAAVRAWLEAATAVAGEVVLAPRPVDGVVVALTGRDGTRWPVAIDAGAGLAQREGEAVALRLTREAIALVCGAPAEFRDRQLIAVEPVAVRRVRASWRAGLQRGQREEVVRGELTDDWPQSRRQAMLNFRAVFAGLRALAWRPEMEFRVLLALEVELDPEPNASASRILTLELGEPSGSGCAGRLAGGTPFALAPADCAALLAPFR